MNRRRLLAAVAFGLGACSDVPDVPAVAPVAGRSVPRVDAQTYARLRGQWRGVEVGGSLGWTFSFGDLWAVVVRSDAGDWYEGFAGLHFELGADPDGTTRVPPGSGLLDVDVWTSRRGAHDGQVSLGVIYFDSQTDLKLCASEPGVHVRALSYDRSSPEVRCFRLKKVDGEPLRSRMPPVEKEPAPVERDDPRVR